ncbi:hypothetical protein M413DRAFT_79084 [Hebeloma cylindrosporum]|uniref:Uncharacterized protein n=1 Tax=Hebeloma cylindrosporum TaxID=76867 RepID=A0A0C2XD11_HEBCY|nr:hypothetical protein M413DRAFT_79084 [Hebeloma cylindrosporum h7]
METPLAGGLQAVYDAVISSLQCRRPPMLQFRVLQSLMRVPSETMGFLRRARSVDILPLLSALLEDCNPEYKEVVRKFLMEFIDGCIFIMDGHTGYVSSVAFSPDGKHVVSGSSDSTVRIWNPQTGKQVERPLQGHTAPIVYVAFSADNGGIISTDKDNILRTWDAGTAEPVGAPFRGHTQSVLCVAFSPDGKRIVSGSYDQTIRIWDVEAAEATGKPVGEPFRGHTKSVLCVAFSPDGKRIVLGSYDQTIRIWDVEAAEAVAGLCSNQGDLYSNPSPSHFPVFDSSNFLLQSTVYIWLFLSLCIPPMQIIV